MQNIKPLQEPPQFQYGDAVYPAAHPERKGRICDMVWHFKRQAVMYFIGTERAKISRRYDADELILADENH